MRELLDLAIDKGVKKFITRAVNAGLTLNHGSPRSSPNDEDRFRHQIEDLG